MKESSGISLIILVITIIVILILAGTVILSLVNSDTIGMSKEAQFKANVDAYQSELNLILANEYFKNNDFKQESFDIPTWDGNGDGTGTIKEYIPSLDKKQAEKYKIEDGKLVYIGDDANEMLWFANIGKTSTEDPQEPEEPEIIVKETSSDSSLYSISGIDYSFLVDGKEFFLGYSSWFPAWYLGVVEPLEPKYTLKFLVNAQSSDYGSYNRAWAQCDKKYKITVYATVNYSGLGLVEGSNKWYYYTNSKEIDNDDSLPSIMSHTSTKMYFNNVYCTSDSFWTEYYESIPTNDIAKVSNVKIYKSGE